MKIYIRQIRPYLKPLKMSVYDHYPNVYDVWFPEEDKEKLIKQIDVPEHYELMFEERFIQPLPARCGKCVYETHCPGRNTDINQTCHNYKRDAPDGGYYG